MYVSDARAAAVEELALTVGESPCVDACAGSLVLVPDLTQVDQQAR